MSRRTGNPEDPTNFKNPSGPPLRLCYCPVHGRTTEAEAAERDLSCLHCRAWLRRLNPRARRAKRTGES